ncbi:fimbria/pilus periplasmic chaperone [Pantoea ananatis]|uniref:fimbria/pilus periplasmic chaperone n=1 Tax=Pantoea ananas TaxID=553 RepID=UPI003FA48F85
MHNETVKNTPPSSQSALRGTGRQALLAALLLAALGAQQAQAAIALDRTRVIFDGNQKSVSLSVTNQNKQLPYLAQGWIEDAQGTKIQSPLIVLPPVQRIEPGKGSQVKIQALPASRLLAQDRETLYYFNLREIPPRSTKPNTLQIALQTRIKLFYRPSSIAMDSSGAPPQMQLMLTKRGDKYVVNNPTPYYVTIVDAGSKKDTPGVKGFEPIMVPPEGNLPLSVSAASLGANPVLTYVNDYGGRPQLSFRCSGAYCTVMPDKQGR